MDIQRKSIVSRSTADIFKIFCCVVIEFFNSKDPMRLMKKTYLFSVQEGMPHANASKICRIYGYTVLFPIIGNVVNVQSPDIGKPDIYCRND
jgi:hypothetical protein